MRLWSSIICYLFLALPVVYAQEGRFVSGVERWQKQGGIRVGVSENFPPLAYVDREKNIWGYLPEVCARVIEIAKQQWQLPQLRFIPVLTSNISTSLVPQSGAELDLDCSGNSAKYNSIYERRSLFSLPVYVAPIRALVRQEARIRSLEDMTGSKIVTVAGTAHERYIKSYAVLRGIHLRLSVARNLNEAFNLLANAQVDAIISDEISLLSLLAASGQRDTYGLVKEQFAIETYRIAIPSGEESLKKIVDTALLSLIQSQQLDAIHRRWFMSPLPSLGVNLRMPVNMAFRGYLQNPSDVKFDNKN